MPSKKTTTDIGNILGRSTSTIIKWSNDFSDLLSGEADRESGEVREFTDQDLIVFRLIDQERRRDKRARVEVIRDRVKARLEAATGDQDIDFDSLDDIEPSEIVRFQERISALETTILNQRREIERLETLLEDAQKQVKENTTYKGRYEQLKDIQEKYEKLLRENALLEYKLEQLENDTDG